MNSLVTANTAIARVKEEKDLLKQQLQKNDQNTQRLFQKNIQDLIRLVGTIVIIPNIGSRERDAYVTLGIRIKKLQIFQLENISQRLCWLGNPVISFLLFLISIGIGIFWASSTVGLDAVTADTSSSILIIIFCLILIDLLFFFLIKGFVLGVDKHFHLEPARYLRFLAILILSTASVGCLAFGVMLFLRMTEAGF